MVKIIAAEYTFECKCGWSGKDGDLVLKVIWDGEADIYVCPECYGDSEDKQDFFFDTDFQELNPKPSEPRTTRVAITDDNGNILQINDVIPINGHTSLVLTPYDAVLKHVEVSSDMVKIVVAGK